MITFISVPFLSLKSQLTLQLGRLLLLITLIFSDNIPKQQRKKKKKRLTSNSQNSTIKTMNSEKPTLSYIAIPGIGMEAGHLKVRPRQPLFACVSAAAAKRQQHEREFEPTTAQLLKHPLTLVTLVPKDAALFAAGAIAGAAAKTVTAPLDRVKLLMQTHGVRVGQESANKAIGFFEAINMIGKEEGIKGYWKGNLPQVIRIIPYSAVQLCSYEIYKKLFRGKDGELSVLGRLAAGACAGMTSTLITYPLDVLRLRLAVEPGCRTMSQVALGMLKEEGIASFYNGLAPSLISIAPYIAVNFCIFDLVKKSLPEKYQKRPETSLITAVVSASLATLTCYPLDTVRRQMQMRGTPYNTVLDAIPGIVARDGLIGLYRGFVPNALKNLPNSSIRLTTFDTVKGLIAAGEKEFQRIVEENRRNAKTSS